MARMRRLPADVLDEFKRQGARGGKIASKRMTAAQRKARAVKASQAATLARAKKKQQKTAR